MSNGFTIHIDANRAVFSATKNLDKYSEETKKAIQDVVRKGTEETMKEAVHLAPYGKTGNLKAGIKMDFNGGDRAQGIVRSTSKHSAFVELGTEDRIVAPKRAKALKLQDGRFVKGDIYNGRMEKAPFLRPAAEKTAPKITAQIEEVLKRDPSA